MVSWESFLNFWQHINVMNDVDNVQYTLLKQGLWMKELLGKDLPRNRKNDGCIPFECCWNSMNKGDLLWECEAMWGWQATVACLEACWRLLSGWVPPTLRLTPTPRGKTKPKSISNSFNNCNRTICGVCYKKEPCRKVHISRIILLLLLIELLLLKAFLKRQKTGNVLSSCA